MNIKALKISCILSLGLILVSCGGQSFEEQIKNDISSKMATGICKEIPKGATISNIVVGEIVDIGLEGMTDVTIEFDHEIDGVKKHHESAILYIKRGSSYTLAVLGGCEYKMK